DNLQRLVSSFYDLSRLHNKDYIFNLKKVSLKTILCDNIALYYNDFINKNIEPVIYIDESISSIISDEEAISRVFSNLIGNMLKHGEAPMKITLEEKEGYIISKFINFAPNLKSEKVEKLFHRFYIGDKARTSQNTGLGLSIAKELVEQLGHEIKGDFLDKNLVITIKWTILF
ncbi:MAG: sensor histidine kinase, partial [Sarcina sp.]